MLSSATKFEGYSLHVSDLSRLDFASFALQTTTDVLELPETGDNSELPQYRDHGAVCPVLPIPSSTRLWLDSHCHGAMQA